MRRLGWFLGLALAIAACKSTTPPVTPRKPAVASPGPAVVLTPGPGNTPATVPTQVPSATPLATGSTPPTPALPTTAPTAAPAGTLLSGHLLVPAALLSEGGASVLSDAGGSVVSNNGGSVISDQGAAIIANNSGSILSNNSAGYRLLATGDKGLANAFLYLTNRDEKFYLGAKTQAVFATGTGADGGYAFGADDAFPTGKDVIVNALLDDNQRMTGFLVPAAGGKSTLDVSLASTLATELLRAEATRRAKALGSYDAAAVTAAVKATDVALSGGQIASRKGASAVFDLRLQHLDRLRNQYVVAFGVAEAANQVLHDVSNAWKALFGYRPAPVTTLAGNGAAPDVDTSVPRATGDSGATVAASALGVPMGYVGGIAIAPHGDVLVSGYASDTSSGHVRWLRPEDGSLRVSTLWFPDVRFQQPGGLAVDKDVTGSTASPGSVLLAGSSANFVVRTPIVDAARRDVNGLARFPQTFVAGEFVPISADDGDNPALVDGLPPAVDTSAPATSLWRLGDEGQRTYMSGAAVPSPARFAHINHPQDVAVDEVGNVYIADTWNQRVRMIPKVDGSYFGYKQPLDANHDGLVEGFGASTPMKAGCIYTIAGNPTWDTRTTDHGGHWFPDFAGDGGPAQQAKLASPTALAFANNTLYLVDADNQRIRSISRSTGVIQTMAGKPAGGQVQNGGLFAFPGASSADGLAATQASLNQPRGLAVDPKGRLFFYDAGSQRVRMVDTGGTLTTVAGHLPDAVGSFGALDGDGDALFGVTLQDVRDLACDGQGNVLLADFANRRIRKLWRQWE